MDLGFFRVGRIITAICCGLTMVWKQMAVLLDMWVPASIAQSNFEYLSLLVIGLYSLGFFEAILGEVVNYQFALLRMVHTIFDTAVWLFMPQAFMIFIVGLFGESASSYTYVQMEVYWIAHLVATFYLLIPYTVAVIIGGAFSLVVRRH